MPFKLGYSLNSSDRHQTLEMIPRSPLDNSSNVIIRRDQKRSVRYRGEFNLYIVRNDKSWLTKNDSEQSLINNTFK